LDPLGALQEAGCRALALDVTDEASMSETNVFGALRMARIVLPRMRAKGAGTIVNISSIGGRFTVPGGAYHATKCAVEAMSDALRMEVARFGIGVICAEPGFIRSDFASTAVDSAWDRVIGRQYGA
jgi:NAD(P)-dependent dehydrogenase (short-subunit alcohol dehydrogenase family)